MLNNYNVEDRAREILNVLKESEVNLETLDYDKLEEILIKCNKDNN